MNTLDLDTQLTYSVAPWHISSTFFQRVADEKCKEYPLLVLDTGEHYMIASAKKPAVIEAGVKLYKELDVSIKVIQTSHYGTEGLKEFVFETCGRMPQTAQGQVVLGDLLEDLSVFSKFWKSKSKYTTGTSKVQEAKASGSTTGLQSRQPKGWSSVTSEIVGMPDFRPKKAGAAAPTHASPAEPVQSYNESVSDAPMELDAYFGMLKPQSYERQEPLDRKTSIIFNELYNVCLVVDGKDGLASVDDICEEFPEFVVIRSLPVDNGQLEQCRKFFHKKTFTDLNEAKRKFDAFADLHDLHTSETVTSACKERDAVMSVLKTFFVLSNNCENRMKASELFGYIELRLCNEKDKGASLSRRLSGYMLEAGLKKKRYADGIYYYGVQLATSPMSSRPQTLEELVEQRSQAVNKPRERVELGTDPIESDRLCVSPPQYETFTPITASVVQPTVDEPNDDEFVELIESSSETSTQPNSQPEQRVGWAPDNAFGANIIRSCNIQTTTL